jgi:hypothetical protein
VQNIVGVLQDQQHFVKCSGFHPVLTFKNNRLGIKCLIFLSYIISVAVLWLLNKSSTSIFCTVFRSRIVRIVQKNIS